MKDKMKYHRRIARISCYLFGLISLIIFFLLLPDKNKIDYQEHIYAGISVEDSDKFRKGIEDTGTEQAKITKKLVTEDLVTAINSNKNIYINTGEFVWLSPYTYVWGYAGIGKDPDSNKEYKKEGLVPDYSYTSDRAYGFHNYIDEYKDDLSDYKNQSKYLYVLYAGLNLFYFPVERENRYDNNRVELHSLFLECVNSVDQETIESKILDYDPATNAFTSTINNLWNIIEFDDNNLRKLSKLNKNPEKEQKILLLITDCFDESIYKKIEQLAYITDEIKKNNITVYHLITDPDPPELDVYKAQVIDNVNPLDLDFKLMLILGIENQNYLQRRFIRRLNLGDMPLNNYPELSFKSEIKYDERSKTFILSGILDKSDIPALNRLLINEHIFKFMNIYLKPVAFFLDSNRLSYWKLFEKGKAGKIFKESRKVYNWFLSDFLNILDPPDCGRVLPRVFFQNQEPRSGIDTLPELKTRLIRKSTPMHFIPVVFFLKQFRKKNLCS